MPSSSTEPEASPPEALTPEALTPEALTPEALTPEFLTPEALTPEALMSEASLEVLVPESWCDSRDLEVGSGVFFSSTSTTAVLFRTNDGEFLLFDQYNCGTVPDDDDGE